MIKLSDLLQGRPFASPAEIKKYITKSIHFDSQRENYHNATELLIYQISFQQTWLIATSQRLYNILDDVNKSNPHINWSISKNKLVTNGKLKINITKHNYKSKTGLVDIGPDHKDWLYSVHLFLDKDITQAIEQLILEQML